MWGWLHIALAVAVAVNGGDGYERDWRERRAIATVPSLRDSRVARVGSQALPGLALPLLLVCSVMCFASSRTALHCIALHITSECADSNDSADGKDSTDTAQCSKAVNVQLAARSALGTLSRLPEHSILSQTGSLHAASITSAHSVRRTVQPATAVVTSQRKLHEASKCALLSERRLLRRKNDGERDAVAANTCEHIPLNYSTDPRELPLDRAPRAGSARCTYCDRRSNISWARSFVPTLDARSQITVTSLSFSHSLPPSAFHYLAEELSHKSHAFILIRSRARATKCDRAWRFVGIAPFLISIIATDASIHSTCSRAEMMPASFISSALDNSAYN